MSGRFRGRGKRGGHGESGFRGRGRGRGRGGISAGHGYHSLADMDDIYLMAPNDYQLSSGASTPRGRGRGSKPNSGSNTPRGRGRGRGILDNLDAASPRGRGRNGPGNQSPRMRGGIGDSPRGRGKGRGGSKLGANAPLSELLFQERPLLRPVVFVPSVFTKTLFQEEEEIFKAVVEEVGEEEQSHVPTADRVFRVFSGGNIPRITSSEDEDEEDELVEIDFNDMAKIMETPTRPAKTIVDIVEEQFTGIRLGGKTPPETPEGAARPVPQPQDIDQVILDMSGSEDVPVEVEDTAMLYAEELERADAAEGSELLPVSDSPSFRTLREAPDFVPDALIPDTPSVEIDVLDAHVMDVEAIDMALNETPVNVDAEAPEVLSGFLIDTQPSHIETPHHRMPQFLEDDDEEVIVYVAPHPGRVSPTIPSSDPAPFLPSTSILTGTTLTSTSTFEEPDTSATPGASSSKNPPSFTSVSFSFTPTPKKARQFTKRSKSKTQLTQRRQEAHATRRRLERQVLFGSFGAMLEEAKLRGTSARDLDPQWDERRRGDSDVDWGDSDENDEAGNGDGLAEGMELDPDLRLDGKAMSGFVKSMSAEGSRFVTMDDIADGQLMRLEDEGGDDDEDVGSSGDEEDETSEDDVAADVAVNAEEEAQIAESDDLVFDEDELDSDEEDSDDDEDSPRTSFQTRLERLRKQTGIKGKARATLSEEDVEDDSEDAFQYSRWEEDDDFIEEIQMMLDENEDILMGRDRKARNKLFRAVRNGAFEDMEDFKPARKKKDRYKDLPPELHDQWQKDREKKAENKRLRALKRLELAADPLTSKKGGNKGRKAMLAAAKLDPTITVIPNRVIDMTTLVQQLRRFVGNIGGPVSMSLPPATKETRKSVHEMALAFNLKSVSKGKGDARYTTLTKTTRTGLFVDERKVAKIMRRASGGGGGGGGGEFMGSNTRGGRSTGTAMPRHREGEEVGKAAPKIGESNVGFKMLALMGWSEGQRIGITGGLDAPLTAVIKNTKLGLGATK